MSYDLLKQVSALKRQADKKTQLHQIAELAHELQKERVRFDAEIADLQIHNASLLERQQVLVEENGVLSDRLAHIENVRDALTTALDERAEHCRENEGIIADLERQRAEIQGELDALRESALDEALRHEIECCRSLAARCLFVIGFGRSSTTITMDMLNSLQEVLLLGEANFYLPLRPANFREAFNMQHTGFGNVLTKSSYAPNLIPDRAHSWWEWLSEAGKHYHILGEKIAFSAFHFSECGVDEIRSFYEARFFESRFIFTLRNPIDTLISLAKHNELVEDEKLRSHIVAWLDYISLWIGFVRIFPNTMTINSEKYNDAVLNQVVSFTGLDFSGAFSQLSQSVRRRHRSSKAFPILDAYALELNEIFDTAVMAIGQDRAFWQAGPLNQVIQAVRDLRVRVLSDEKQDLDCSESA